MDWEDYNYEREPAACGRSLPRPDDADQAAGMTMAEAVEVSYMLYNWIHLYIA